MARRAASGNGSGPRTPPLDAPWHISHPPPGLFARRRLVFRRGVRQHDLPTRAMPEEHDTGPKADFAPQANGERFPKEARIRRRAHYQRVQRSKTKVHTKHFIVLMVPSDARRFGVTVTKKIGNAVARNRVKRVAREVFRRRSDLFPPHTDVVMIAKRGAPQIGFDALVAELQQAQSGIARALRSRRGGRKRVEERG